MTLSYTLKTLAITYVFVLCMFPQISTAESLSESVAAFLVAEKDLRAPFGNTSPSVFEFSEKEPLPFTETAQPMGALRLGNLNLTTYANSRPSLSYQLNKNMVLRIKTSRNSALLQLRFHF